MSALKKKSGRYCNIILFLGDIRFGSGRLNWEQIFKTFPNSEKLPFKNVMTRKAAWQPESLPTPRVWIPSIIKLGMKSWDLRPVYLSNTTRSVAVSALLFRISSSLWIFSSRSEGSHFPFRMEAVRPRIRGHVWQLSQICAWRRVRRGHMSELITARPEAWSLYTDLWHSAGRDAPGDDMEMTQPRIITRGVGGRGFIYKSGDGLQIYIVIPSHWTMSTRNLLGRKVNAKNE